MEQLILDFVTGEKYNFCYLCSLISIAKYQVGILD